LRHRGFREFIGDQKRKGSAMKITPQMIEEGWKQDKDGVWVAPRPERVLLVEERRDLSELARGWVKVPIHDPGPQVSAFQRWGLPREGAEIAAGVKVAPPKNDIDPYKELRAQLDQRRRG
jgi:hypothetical protein